MKMAQSESLYNGDVYINDTHHHQQVNHSRDEDPELTTLIPDARPTRGGNFVYLCFLLLGLGTLLPWNFFITADSYWQYKFRNTTEGGDWEKRETELQRLYDPFQVCLSQITNFSFLFVNALFSHMFSQKLRLVGSLSMMILFFSITTILARVPTDDWQLGLFVFTMIIIVVMNAFGAVFQGGLYGIASKFPQRFINAVGMGQALGGVFASGARIVSIYLGVDDVTSAFIYFLIAVCVMGLTLVEYLYVARTNFFRYYARPVTPLDQAADKREEGEQTFKDLVREHFRIFKKVWPLGVAVCFIYFVTLSMFPVISVKVLSTSSNEVWAKLYFQPVSTFLLFNVGDYLGRTMAEFLLWPEKGSKLVYVFSAVRVVFIPLFLLCNHNPKSSIPSVFLNDAWYVVFSGLFGISNGYTTSLCMMYAPRMVPDSEGEKVGSMMAAMIGLGLLIGSLSSFGFVLIR